MKKKTVKTEGPVQKKDFDDLTRRLLNTPPIKKKDLGKKKPDSESK